MATTVMDEVGFAKLARRLGHAFATHAEHICNQLLRDLQITCARTIDVDQQPPAQLLVQSMQPVARRRLCDLGEESMHVQQHQRT